MNRRVAVTGLGAVAATGQDVATLWRTLCDGTSGIAINPQQGWPQARIEFDPTAHFSDRELPMLDRVSQFALVAARQALRQAGLAVADDRQALAQLAAHDIDPVRAGAVFSASIGHQTLDDGYFNFYGRQAKR
ncbi:MAG: hypothetical protein LH480_11015, partial [Rubrivivax sp.]|nr:hypothetical protein [Rubrivivax sp.]